MLRPLTPIAFAAMAAIVPLAPATATTLDYQGYGFETGGFPPSSPGDTLWIPVVVDVASDSLGIDFGSEELTGWIGGLVSSGVQDGGDAVQFFTFEAGRIEFYRDANRNHDFGTNPSNATVPSTFVDGTLCLGGTISDFVLFLDTDSNTGAYEGHVIFDTGACLGQLSAASAEGFTFGGVLTRAAIGGAVIEGYDMQVDGYLEARKVPESVCEVECFGIEEARFDFPRPRHRHGGGRGGDDDDDDDDDDATGGVVAAAAGGARNGEIYDGRNRDRDRDRDRDRHEGQRKFRVDGELIGCESETIDPEEVEIEIRIGDYVQTLPEGVVRPARRRDCDDDVDGPCWVYSNSRGQGTITRFTMQFDEDEGEWDFEVQGRGIDRDELISEDDLLDFALTVDGAQSLTQVQLVQKKEHLRFVRRRDTCGPGSQRPSSGGEAAPAPAQPTAEPLVNSELDATLAAAPNPMTDATTIVLQAPVGGDNVRLRIYDVRGRLVRGLHSGALPVGTSRFGWDGRDESGARVANGIYVYRLESATRVETRKLVVAR